MLFSGRTRSRRRDRESSVRRNIIIGSIGSVLLILVGVGVWHLTRLPSVTIQKVVVEGGETLDHAHITSQVETILDEEYLHVIPHRFFLTYPHDEVAAALLAHDRIESVSVSRKGRTDLAISFTEYTPFALWCASLNSKSPCYFLDVKGYAFGESPLLQGGALVRHVIEAEDDLLEKQVFDQSRFEGVHTFLDRIHTELKLRVTHVLYTKEGDITLNINGGGEIYMRNDGNFDQSFKNLETVLRSKSFDHLEPGNFQYVDIRFGNKIFVNEEPEVTVSTTTMEVGSSTPLLEE